MKEITRYGLQFMQVQVEGRKIDGVWTITGIKDEPAKMRFLPIHVLEFATWSQILNNQAHVLTIPSKKKEVLPEYIFMEKDSKIWVTEENIDEYTKHGMVKK